MLTPEQLQEIRDCVEQTPVVLRDASHVRIAALLDTIDKLVGALKESRRLINTLRAVATEYECDAILAQFDKGSVASAVIDDVLDPILAKLITPKG